jgi:hypothetical protein
MWKNRRKYSGPPAPARNLMTVPTAPEDILELANEHGWVVNLEHSTTVPSAGSFIAELAGSLGGRPFNVYFWKRATGYAIVMPVGNVPLVKIKFDPETGLTQYPQNPQLGRRLMTMDVQYALRAARLTFLDLNGQRVSSAEDGRQYAGTVIGQVQALFRVADALPAGVLAEYGARVS